MYKLANAQSTLAGLIKAKTNKKLKTVTTEGGTEKKFSKLLVAPLPNPAFVEEVREPVPVEMTGKLEDVGKRCTVSGYDGVTGTIRFVGVCGDDGKKKVGVELDQPKGKHSGTSKGYVYFKCPKKCGVLVGQSKITILDDVSSGGGGSDGDDAPDNYLQVGCTGDGGVPEEEANDGEGRQDTGGDAEAAPAPAAVAGTGPTLAPVLDVTTPVQTPAATTAPTPIAEAAPTEHATTAAPTAITAELAPTHVATEVPPLPAAPTEAAAEEPRKIPAPKPSTTSASPVAAPAPGNENETASASTGTEVLVDPPQPTAPPTPMPVEEVPTPAVVQVANPPQSATVHAPVLAEAGAAPASAPAAPAPTVDATPPEPTPQAEAEAEAAVAVPPVQAMWAAAEQDANGLLPAGVVANILSSSGLTQKVLRTVWSSAKKNAVVKSGGATMNQTEFTEAVSLAIAAGGVFAD